MDLGQLEGEAVQVDPAVDQRDLLVLPGVVGPNQLPDGELGVPDAISGTAALQSSMQHQAAVYGSITHDLAAQGGISTWCDSNTCYMEGGVEAHKHNILGNLQHLQ